MSKLAFDDSYEEAFAFDQNRHFSCAAGYCKKQWPKPFSPIIQTHLAKDRLTGGMVGACF